MICKYAPLSLVLTSVTCPAVISQTSWSSRTQKCLRRRCFPRGPEWLATASQSRAGWVTFAGPRLPLITLSEVHSPHSLLLILYPSGCKQITNGNPNRESSLGRVTLLDQSCWATVQPQVAPTLARGWRVTRAPAPSPLGSRACSLSPGCRLSLKRPHGVGRRAWKRIS